MSATIDTPEIRPRRPLVVVSNREPYQHTRARDGSIQWSPTTGGVAVALDALMRERGGVWIAHGSGEADRDVVDEHDRVIVPPDRPGYTLRRLWLTEEEAKQLADYLQATHLLVECLELASVTDREGIKERLLLPPR